MATRGTGGGAGREGQEVVTGGRPSSRAPGSLGPGGLPSTRTLRSGRLGEQAVGTFNLDNYAVTHQKMERQAYSDLMDENPVINGDFDVWQRGTSFAAVANGDYTADRWRYAKSGAMVHTISRSTDVPSVEPTTTQNQGAYHLSNYSILVDCTTVDASIAAGDFCQLQQRIEGYLFKSIAQRTNFTVSFWVKSTKTGIFCFRATNSAANRSYVDEYVVTTADTWEWNYITIPATPIGGTWDYTNGIGLNIGWCLAAGTSLQGAKATWNSADDMATASQVNACDSTSNNFLLSEVKVVPGPVPARMSYVDFQRELARSQRYCFKTFPYATAPAQNAGIPGALAYQLPAESGTGDVGAYLQYAVPMRATPTITYYNPSAANALWRNLTDAADSGAASSGSTLASERGHLVVNAGVVGDGTSDILAIHAQAVAEL